METYLIQLTNHKAYRLLQDLEVLNIIKVLKKDDASSKKSGDKNKPASFRGALKLDKQQYEDFQKHAKDIRNEWPEKF